MATDLTPKGTSDEIWGGVATEKERMDQIGNTGFEISGDLEAVREAKLKEADEIIAKIAPRQHEIGLEIGSGLGIHTSKIANNCRAVHTIDVSDHFRDLFSYYTADNDNIIRHVQSFFQMMADIEDSSVDFGWSVAVFCHMHLYDIYFYMQELSKKLKPGGRFLINWQSADTIQFGQDWFTDIAGEFLNVGKFVPIWQTCVQFHPNEFYYRVADHFGMDATRRFSDGAYTEAVFVRREY